MKGHFEACAAVMKMPPTNKSAPNTVHIVQPPQSQRPYRNADNARAKLKAPLTGEARLHTMTNGVLAGLLAGLGPRCLEQERHTFHIFWSPSHRRVAGWMAGLRPATRSERKRPSKSPDPF